MSENKTVETQPTEESLENRLFRDARENPQEAFKTLELSRMLYLDEKYSSILIDRDDCGGIFFAGLLDRSDDPNAKRWWILVDYLPRNYPGFSIALHFVTDCELRDEISRWLPGLESILRDVAGLFPEAESKWKEVA